MLAKILEIFQNPQKLAYWSHKVTRIVAYWSLFVQKFGVLVTHFFVPTFSPHDSKKTHFIVLEPLFRPVGTDFEVGGGQNFLKVVSPWGMF